MQSNQIEMVMLYNISYYVVISVVLLIGNELGGHQRLDQYDSCNLIYKDYKGHYFDIDGNRRKLGNARTMQKFDPYAIEVFNYVTKRITVISDYEPGLDLKVSIIIEKDGCLSNFRIISGISDCHKNIIRVNMSPLDCVGSWPKPDKELELVFDIHIYKG